MPDAFIFSSIQINEVDKQAFIDASKPIYDQFGKQVKGGKKLVDKAFALAK